MDEQSKDESQPDQPRMVPSYLNYLRWLETDEVIAKAMGSEPNADSALGWLCRTLTPPVLPVLRLRYAKVANADNHLALFPYKTNIAVKVLIPLLQAKAAFVMGHELSCIAMCGMVGEMLANLRFEMSPHGRGPQALNEDQQKKLFGKPFGRLDHSRRIDVLDSLGLVDKPTADLFRDLASKRNDYLHGFSQPHETLGADACRLYGVTALLVGRITGLSVKGTQVSMSQELLDYLDDQA